ncbi:GNAT family N-acetyltransferase [Dactylosporangium sp. CA-139114]|uniref:GNAT family N-acetyltransferase n=1 Tax=Dactylosporangium sp. CA-139114 TaxID=3239931 RepID=UPI003D974BCE
MTAARPDFGIHTPSIDATGAVTATLTEGYLDGDLASWLVPDRATRRAVCTARFGILAELFLRRGQVDATEDLDAVALWWPVGRLLEMDVPDHDARLAQAMGDAAGRFLALDTAARALHPSYRPHHYLAFLAVRPDRQGKGMGSALLRHHHARLDLEATPAYLEAPGPRSRALFERHGYTAWDPIPIPNGPALHPMWRPGTFRR